MGRIEPSVGQPPAGFRRDARAKKAKATINQVIPASLPAHPRARHGIENTKLVVNIPPKNNEQMQRVNAPENGCRHTLMVADTLTAARHCARSMSITQSHNFHPPKIAILNMASPLSPGGGFVNGANSQEESLCMRTTLLPSLKDEYYRLPELGAIFTPDVMVFREEGSDKVLPKKHRWFVDCITAAMLRNPELDHDEDRAVYANDQDRQLVLQKMRMVMRICEAEGINTIVLGAWGCGAFGNPVNEIAQAWKKVLLPRQDHKGKVKKESWPGVEHVVFAIKDVRMATAFAAAFGGGLGREELLQDVDSEEEQVDAEKTNHEQLLVKIEELEARIATTTNPQVCKQLGVILESLRKQLPNTPSSGEDSE